MTDMHVIFFRLDNLTEELSSMRKQVEELYLFYLVIILIKKFLFSDFIMFFVRFRNLKWLLPRLKEEWPCVVVRTPKCFSLCFIFKIMWCFHVRLRLSRFRFSQPAGRVNKIVVFVVVVAGVFFEKQKQWRIWEVTSRKLRRNVFLQYC